MQFEWGLKCHVPYYVAAHRVHAFLDTEVSNPFISVMEDSTNQAPACAPSGTPQINGNCTAERNRAGNSRSANQGSQANRFNVSKTFDGSLYYRQSNLTLNDKQRGENSFGEPQRNGYHHPTTSSLTPVQIKVPPIVVFSELPVQKSSEVGSGENASYLERLKRSFPSNGSHLNSNSQESLYEKFSQRSRELSHKEEKHKDDTGGKKEHSPKSVSFATSVKDVDKPRKSTSPDKREDSSKRIASARHVPATPRVHKVQSNVVLTDGTGQNLIGSSLQNGDMKRSVDQKPRQQTAMMESRYCDTGEEHAALPPSPPTRDTNSRVPNQLDSQSGSVQVLSLYDEKSLFSSNFSHSSGSFPRQSNVNLGFDGSKTLLSSARSSYALKRDMYVRQSNSKVDFTPSRSLRASRDASLTIEELLSSGSANSSPENSPPTKFAPQFDRKSYSSSKKEHSLDDYDSGRGGLLQDLRYSVFCYYAG